MALSNAVFERKLALGTLDKDISTDAYLKIGADFIITNRPKIGIDLVNLSLRNALNLPSGCNTRQGSETAKPKSFETWETFIGKVHTANAFVCDFDYYICIKFALEKSNLKSCISNDLNYGPGSWR